MAGKLGITLQFTENKAIQSRSQSSPRFDKQGLHLVQNKKSPAEKLYSSSKTVVNTATVFGFYLQL